MENIEEKQFSYPSVVERYYNTRYKTDVKGKSGEDQCLLFHSNRICIIGIAPSHVLITDKKEIEKIDFQVTEKINRLENKVSGKSKKGGQWVNDEAPLCRVTCTDGSTYTVSSCLNGKLVEVNENLIADPSLLVDKPQGEGYVAIVLPKLGASEKQRDQLLEYEQYMAIVNNRINPDTSVNM